MDNEVEELKKQIAALKTEAEVMRTNLGYVQKILIGGLLVTGMNFLGILITIVSLLKNG